MGNSRTIFGFLVGALCAVLVLAPAGFARAGDTGPRLFVPTSAWLVGPASPVSLAGTGKSMPCVMINQYDNGFSFRISGGGGQVMAIAIDFRQSVFEAGESYRVNIEVPPYVDVALPGTAYNEATLIMNTQQIDGFYTNLSKGKKIKLGVGNSKMEFSLLGVADGLERIESCYGGGSQEFTPDALVPVPAGGNYLKVTPDRPAGQQVMPRDSIITPLPGEEHVEAALDNAALPQAVAAEMNNIEPAAAPPVVKEHQKGQMLAQSWASPFVERKAKAEPHKIMATPAARVDTRSAHSWGAQAGSSLQDALRVWAEEAHVELMWTAEQDFSVVKSLRVEGPFEAAVLAMLGQYEGAEMRPVGRIYNDPTVAGRKILLVETHKEY